MLRVNFASELLSHVRRRVSIYILNHDKPYEDAVTTPLVRGSYFPPHRPTRERDCHRGLSSRRVKDALGISSSLYREVSGGQQRLRDRTGCLIEVEELVTSALKLPAPAPKDSV